MCSGSKKSSSCAASLCGLIGSSVSKNVKKLRSTAGHAIVRRDAITAALLPGGPEEMARLGAEEEERCFSHLKWEATTPAARSPESTVSPLASPS